MRIAVFGANGSTGSEIVRFTKQDHHVIAAVRRPEKVKDIEGIEVAQIDLNNSTSIEQAIEGCDAVVVAIGHGGIGAAAKPTTLYSSSIRTIRAAMRRTGVKRIIVLSSGGVVQDDAAPWFYKFLLRPYLINTYIDMTKMETILEESEDIEWTAVRLTYLLEGKSKPFIVEEGKIGRGNFKIHFVDAGRFIAQELSQRQWINQHPVIGYAK